MNIVKDITEENFKKYGMIIDFPKNEEGNFHIVASDIKPWRLAVFRYSNSEIDRIECHPDSMESFEPLSGTTLLLTAEHERPDDYQIFILNRPVILRKGVWHQTMVIKGSASVKITENADVYSIYHDLHEKCNVSYVSNV